MKPLEGGMVSNKQNLEGYRERISKILVKWGLSTRQVAIDELLGLLQEAREERVREYRKFLKSKLMSGNNSLDDPGLYNLLISWIDAQEREAR